MTEEKITLDENINIFSNELKRCFSKDYIEEIARETGFVKRKGKIDAWELVYLCSFMDVEVARNTLVTLCTKLSSKIGVVISSQALDQRLNKRCVLFLKKIFEKLLRQTITNNTCIQSIWDKYFFYGRSGEISTNRLEDQELSVLSLHLLQNCLVYINTLMIQQVLSEKKWYGMI